MLIDQLQLCGNALYERRGAQELRLEVQSVFQVRSRFFVELTTTLR